LHALAGRGQSRHEIEKRLRSRELSEEVVATEIEALEEAGLIDDETLAADLVDKYAVRGGLGRRAVEDKLRSRKLSAQVINEALSVLSHEGEKEAVRELALTKIRSLESVAPDVAKRRLQGFLLRKGYSPSDVYPLVSELLG
jgi:SOS response regulatory protein OraA/RecX